MNATTYRAFQVVSFILGIVAIAFGVLLPWTEYFDASVLLPGTSVMTPVYLTGACAPLVWAALLVAWSSRALRGLSTGQKIRIGTVAILGSLSIAGTWHGYVLRGTLLAFRYRQSVQCVLMFVGAILLTASLLETPIWRVWRSLLVLARRVGYGRLSIYLALFVLFASATLGGFVLEGIPHIGDATTYLIEGRALWTGRLALEVPKHAELFPHPLFSVTDAGYVGQYPIGWPVILGLFDRLGARWLAGPLLAAGVVLLTYRVVRRQAGHRLATITTILLAGCPWLWFNAATQMSHIASAFWLMVFLDGFTAIRREPTTLKGCVAGVGLGAAVITRPQDALFFSLPCIVATLTSIRRCAAKSLITYAVVALGGVVGAAGYLGVNRYLMGAASTSTYGQSVLTMLLAQSPSSIPRALSWAHENWVWLSTQAYAHVVPTGLLIAVGLVFGYARVRKVGLLVLCSTSHLACYTAFVFVSRPWVGPRWLVPLMPGMAYVIACGLQSAIQAGRTTTPMTPIARAYLAVVAVSIAVSWIVAVPAKAVDLWIAPPHGVDGRVARAAKSARLRHAVVALPNSHTLQSGEMNYKRQRAGVWMMRVPFEDSPVVFVAKIEGWEWMALESYPGRDLYQMNEEPGNYDIRPVSEATGLLGESSASCPPTAHAGVR